MEIGGYFEWESQPETQCWHPNANLVLKSGRVCVRFLLESESPRKVWVPYYTCDGLIEPFSSATAEIEYYSINEHLELNMPWPDLADDQRLIYVNYFGVKNQYVRELEEHFGERLWVEHTQAFFYQPSDPRSFHFNSVRKFFGVPDGAYMYVPSNSQLTLADDIQRNSQYRIEHLLLRRDGKTRAGYPVFQENERLTGEGIQRISLLSEAMLGNVNYEFVANRRIQNYDHLHQFLGASNQFPASVLENSQGVPHCYPYLPFNSLHKEIFWNQGIYIPRFWSECLDRITHGFEWEKQLAADLLPLPVDQRYSTQEMDTLIEAIKG